MAEQDTGAGMNAADLYSEEMFTDRRVGTIQRLTPVTAEGARDEGRPVLYVGQAQVMTPAGALPLSFEIPAASLAEAIEGFGPAAEKAVQALHLSRGQEAWGHVVAKLLVVLPDDILVPDDLVDTARVLDNFYIPTRYPNSHPDGPPFAHYGPRQSQEAIACAGAILEFVRSAMA